MKRSKTASLKRMEALAKDSAKRLCKKISGKQGLLHPDKFINIYIHVVIGITKPFISCTASECDKKYMSLHELGLSVRTTNRIEWEGITTVGDLIKKSADDLLKIRGFGPTNLEEVRYKLAAHGLKLKTK